MLDAAIFCLAMTIYYEARNEPQIGQDAVANVILNRADWKLHKICHEVFKPKQISSFNTPVPIPQEKNKAWRRAQKIARHTLTRGPSWDITNGATYFYNPTFADPYWALVCEPRVTIANHHFCYIPYNG